MIIKYLEVNNHPTLTAATGSCPLTFVLAISQLPGNISGMIDYERSKILYGFFFHGILDDIEVFITFPNFIGSEYILSFSNLWQNPQDLIYKRNEKYKRFLVLNDPTGKTVKPMIPIKHRDLDTR